MNKYLFSIIYEQNLRYNFENTKICSFACNAESNWQEVNPPPNHIYRKQVNSPMCRKVATPHPQSKQALPAVMKARDSMNIQNKMTKAIHWKNLY